MPSDSPNAVHLVHHLDIFTLKNSISLYADVLIPYYKPLKGIIPLSLIYNCRKLSFFIYDWIYFATDIDGNVISLASSSAMIDFAISFAITRIAKSRP